MLQMSHSKLCVCVWGGGGGGDFHTSEQQKFDTIQCYFELPDPIHGCFELDS